MIRRLLGALWRSDDGVAAVYVALTLPVLFGTAALTIDLSRGLTLNTELQQAADAAALAGAAELNGQTGARSRATTAAQGAFGVNNQTYASGGNAVTIASITFLSSIAATDPPLLPPSGTASGDVVATGDVDAAYIKVEVAQRSVATMLISAAAALIPGLPSESAITTTAFAVAGFQQVACTDFALLLCAPPNVTLTPGMQIDAKEHGTSWTPGAFGLVVGPLGKGAAAGAKYLASASAGNTACRSTSFQVQNGNVTSEYTGINTRFDLYGSPHFNSPADKTTYPPARNVTKGYTVTGKAVCNQQPDPTHAKALPRDNCFATGCSPDPRFGNGAWDRAGYWAVNHGTPLPAALTSASRYATYRYEIDNGLIPKPVAPATTKENGAPACSPATPTDTPDRRVMNIAIVDCSSQSLSGTVRPTGLISAFITEPELAPPNDDIWIEVISIVGPPSPSNNVIHNIVQLYR
jgi:Flp pilus assembly protein TadG